MLIREREIPGGHPATRSALAAAGPYPGAQAANGRNCSGVGIRGSGSRRRVLRPDPPESPALLHTVQDEITRPGKTKFDLFERSCKGSSS
jgi:hypothetical protein